VGLESLMAQYRRTLETIKRLNRRYPAQVLEEFIYMPLVKPEELHQQDRMTLWAQQLQQNLKNKMVDGTFYTVDIKEDEPQNLFIPRINLRTHGIEHHYLLTKEFLSSSEYQIISQLGEKLQGLLGDSAYLQRGERKQSVKNFKEVYDWLMGEGKRGLSIQRYKGLGEMNPDQLWETTMDPTSRRMLRVTIEDAVSADQIFTTLMGDQVEPRRQFIETNALSAENIDI
jgi:DNA gyrase subunit B